MRRYTTPKSAFQRTARRVLRRALRRGPRPVGLRDEPVRGGEVRRDDRGARRPPLRARRSRSAARSACSPSDSRPHVRQLLAIDVAAAALERARARDARASTSSGARSPRSSRTATFDLIVASEVLYYLDAPALRGDAGRDRRTSTGTLLAVHWRGPTERYPFTGDEVHDAADGSASARPPTRAGRPSTTSTASTYAARDRRRRPRRARRRPRVPRGRRRRRRDDPHARARPSPTSARRSRRSSCAARLDDARPADRGRGLVRRTTASTSASAARPRRSIPAARTLALVHRRDAPLRRLRARDGRRADAAARPGRDRGMGAAAAQPRDRPRAARPRRDGRRPRS